MRAQGQARTISIITRTGIYNNVGFIMEIVDDRQTEVPGGRFVIASARDLKGDLLVERLRMVFADDTPPEDGSDTSNARPPARLRAAKDRSRGDIAAGEGDQGPILLS